MLAHRGKYQARVAADVIGRKDIDGVAELVDDRRRTIGGATLVGPMAGALLHAATVATVSRITWKSCGAPSRRSPP